MKKFLENLLIVMALALCGLLAFQWVREAHLRAKIQELTQTVDDKSAIITDLQANLKKSEAESARLEVDKTELKGTIETNRQEIVTLKKSADRLEKDVEAKARQIDAYKEAM